MFETRCAAAPCWAEAVAAARPVRAQAHSQAARLQALATALDPQATADGTHQDAGQ